MRDHRIDNIKCILIFCVVLGHLCGVVTFRLSWLAYNYIYVFHMFCFVFLTGMFASSEPKRILRHLVWPYFVFQTLYLLAARYWLHTGEPIQYSRPYWMLWYVFATACWSLLLPLFETKNPKKQGLVMALTVVLALLVGYDREADYPLSLSRVVVYLPSFLAGHYFRHSRFYEALRSGGRRPPVYWIAGGICGIIGLLVLVIVYRLGGRLQSEWLFNANSYLISGYRASWRGAQLLSAAIILAGLLLLTPNREIPVLTAVGRNTMPVYLLHGFVVTLVEQSGLFQRAIPHKSLFVLLITAATVLILSEKHVARLLSPLLRWPGFLEFHRKRYHTEHRKEL